jgi:hypothetical protein
VVASASISRATHVRLRRGYGETSTKLRERSRVR